MVDAETNRRSRYDDSSSRKRKAQEPLEQHESPTHKAQRLDKVTQPEYLNPQAGSVANVLSI